MIYNTYGAFMEDPVSNSMRNQKVLRLIEEAKLVVELAIASWWIKDRVCYYQIIQKMQEWIMGFLNSLSFR